MYAEVRHGIVVSHQTTKFLFGVWLGDPSVSQGSCKVNFATDLKSLILG